MLQVMLLYVSIIVVPASDLERLGKAWSEELPCMAMDNRRTFSENSDTLANLSIRGVQVDGYLREAL